MCNYLFNVCLFKARKAIRGPVLFPIVNFAHRSYRSEEQSKLHEIRFGLQISFQDIERKRKSDINQGPYDRKLTGILEFVLKATLVSWFSVVLGRYVGTLSSATLTLFSI